MHSIPPHERKLLRKMLRYLVSWLTILLALAACASNAQQDIPAAQFFYPNQQIRVPGLPVRVARADDRTAILVAALETIVDNQEVCCGKDSALQDAALSADPLSLKEVSAQVQGRHLLSDGRPISVKAEYLTWDSINPAQIIAPLMNKQALLMEWKSQLYVLYGATFNETLYYSGEREYVIRKLFLLDVRFSGPRREAVFNRESDNWKDVQGLLKLSVIVPQ
jgi:hypothetical protein